MIYSAHELIEIKECKILYGKRDKRRWRPADALFQVDNYINAKNEKHWIVKYNGKHLILRNDEVKLK